MGVRIVTYGDAGEIADRVGLAAQQALAVIGSEGQELVVDAIHNERDPRGYQGRVFTGRAAQSISARPPVRTTNGYSQTTVSLDPSAGKIAAIEHGRRPGKGVPIDPLKVWVRRKLGAQIRDLRAVARKAKLRQPRNFEKEVEQVAFKVSRSIKKRGIPGIAPFKKAANVLRQGRAQEIYEGFLRANLPGGA